MSRILLGTSLLLAAGLYGQSAQAQSPGTGGAQYSASTSATAPQGEYDAVYPATVASVPYSVKNQYIDVRGAKVLSAINIQWAMVDSVPGAHAVSADDESNGYTLEATDKSGHFRRYVNHGDGTLSGTLRVPVNAGPLTFDSESSITDTNGQVTKAPSVTLSFIVRQVYIA